MSWKIYGIILASNHQLWRYNGHFIPQHGDILLDMADDEFLSLFNRPRMLSENGCFFSGQIDQIDLCQVGDHPDLGMEHSD